MASLSVASCVRGERRAARIPKGLCWRQRAFYKYSSTSWERRERQEEWACFLSASCYGLRLTKACLSVPVVSSEEHLCRALEISLSGTVMGRTTSAGSRRVEKNQEQRRLKWNSSNCGLSEFKGTVHPKNTFSPFYLCTVWETWETLPAMFILLCYSQKS